MVQFSLKLADNRVDKWSSHYLDYKSLKETIAQQKRSRRAEKFLEARRASALSLQVAGSRGNSTDSRPCEETKLLSLPILQSSKRALIADTLGSSSTPSSFEAQLQREIDKVEDFFVRTVDDCRIELASLRRTLPMDHFIPGYTNGAFEGEPRRDIDSWSRTNGAMPKLGKKEEESLKRALLALYRDLTLLKNFSIVNYTAVVKITKKYDKNLKHNADELPLPWNPAGPLTPKILPAVQRKAFFKAGSLEEVISQTEEFFAVNFCGGDVAQAKGLMLPQKVDERIDAAQFQLGYYLGIAAVLMAWVVWDCIFEPDYNDPVFRNEWRASVFLQPAFPVYRAIAGILLLRWCWGVSSLVWGRARINYIYLFDMDPREVTIPLNVLNNVALEIIVVLANLLIYFKHLMNHFPLAHDFPAGVVPLFLCIFIMFKMIYPFRKAWEIWRTILRVFASPFFKVSFFSTYVADVMSSSVKTIQDIAWAFFFFLSGDFLLSAEEYHARGPSWQHSAWYANVVVPALCALPLVLRFAQCVKRYGETRKRTPHLLNCLKYMMAFAVALFGVLVPTPYITANAVKTTWFVLYIISTTYTFFWDVVQDWGLGDRNYGFLRKKRLFSRSWVYYAAIVTDLILRFNWVYSLMPPRHDSLPFVHSSTLSVGLTTVVIVLEYLRRTMWGCFRVENEHLNNTEEYRSEKHVPLHFTTTTTRPTTKPLQNSVVIKEVVIVTVVGIAVAVMSIMAAKLQPEA